MQQWQPLTCITEVPSLDGSSLTKWPTKIIPKWLLIILEVLRSEAAFSTRTHFYIYIYILWIHCHLPLNKQICLLPALTWPFSLRRGRLDWKDWTVISEPVSQHANRKGHWVCPQHCNRSTNTFYYFYDALGT